MDPVEAKNGYRIPNCTSWFAGCRIKVHKLKLDPALVCRIGSRSSSDGLQQTGLLTSEHLREAQQKLSDCRESE